MSIMPLNTAENGPAVPLGEPPDAQPTTLADACEQFLGHARRAMRDGVQPDEFQLLGATFKSISMEMKATMARQSAGGAGGAPGDFQQPAGPSNETQDYGSAAGATPMEG